YVNGNWVLQPDAGITLAGTNFATLATDPETGNFITDNSGAYAAYGNFVTNEVYNAVPQQSSNPNAPGYAPNIQLFNGFQNSMSTGVEASFQTLGTTFLSSLNFGPSPPIPPGNNITTPQQVVLNSGIWAPNGPTAAGGGGAGDPGTPTVANLGVGLQLA